MFVVMYVIYDYWVLFWVFVGLWFVFVSVWIIGIVVVIWFFLFIVVSINMVRRFVISGNFF